MKDEIIFGVSEAARRFQTTDKAIKSWIDKKKIIAEKVGRFHRISLQSVADYILSGKTHAHRVTIERAQAIRNGSI